MFSCLPKTLYSHLYAQILIKIQTCPFIMASGKTRWRQERFRSPKISPERCREYWAKRGQSCHFGANKECQQFIIFGGQLASIYNEKLSTPCTDIGSQFHLTLDTMCRNNKLLASCISEASYAIFSA